MSDTLKHVRNLVVGGTVCGTLAALYGAPLVMVVFAVVGGLYLGGSYSMKTKVA